MARYIDVEGYRKLFDEEYKKTRKLISEGETHLDNLAEGFSEASRVIDLIPTADVVEVVRCKNCVKHQTPDCTMWYQCSVCGGQWSWENDAAFCSLGERKGT